MEWKARSKRGTHAASLTGDRLDNSIKKIRRNLWKLSLSLSFYFTSDLL